MSLSYNFDIINDQSSYQTLVRHNGMQPLVDDYGIAIGKDCIPLWVADMDFLAPKELVEALSFCAEKGIFGYASVPHSCAEFAAQWQLRNHNWQIHPKNLVFSSGVIYSLQAALLALSQEGDEVLAFKPLYAPFWKMVEHCNRTLIVHQLDSENEQVAIDFDLLETQISSKTKMMCICNPHNPSGRMWSKEELSQLAQICLRHNIIICANEIHSDIFYSGENHIPIATLSKEVADICIVGLSPSKTFNLGGMKISYAHCSNEVMRNKMQATLSHYWGDLPFTNFGITAFETVYSKGHTWYTQLLKYLEANRNFAVNYIRQHMPKLRVIVPQATYLLWIDFRAMSKDELTIIKTLIEQAGVYLNQGSFYGEEGRGFMRLNFACPRSILAEALARMKKALQ